MKIVDRCFVLDFLPLSKGLLPCEIVPRFNFLLPVPENEDFWEIKDFYSGLKDDNITQTWWENCRRLHNVLKVRDLNNFNDVYDVQDVIVLGSILENRWQKIKNVCGYDPRCFTFASTLSGAIERIKSKVIITLPQSTEVVDLMESLLSGDYLSLYKKEIY